MKLKPIASQVLLENNVKYVLETLTGDASTIQKKMFALGNELKADGEDVTDQEVQASMLSALIDADGKIDNVDVSDVESIKKDIKENRNYVLQESTLLHSIEAVGTVLGNTALLNAIAAGLLTIGIKADPESMKAKINKAVGLVKKVTGWPAKAMEKAFSWIAKKLGFGSFGQKIAGLSGVLIITIGFLALAIYMFPSISSGILLIFSIAGVVGKTAEIGHVLKEIWHHILEEIEKGGSSLSGASLAQSMGAGAHR
jgi:hypothetical protein